MDLKKPFNSIDRNSIDQNVEVVDCLQYLGAWLNDTMKSFKHQHAKGWKAFWKLKKIWETNADIKLKIKFFNASVRRVLLYITESYV